MPVRLSAIAGAETSCSAPVPGTEESLAFRYRPNAITPRLQAEYEKSVAAGQATTGLVDQFLRFVSWWDIVDEKDKPVPLDRESVENMSVNLLGALLIAATEDMAPKATKNGRS